MKEVIVSSGPVTKIIDSDVPKPGPHQLLIKVVVAGTNPKDWKVPEWRDMSGNTGDDVAGIVEDVGEGVWEFQKGDKVAGFHEMGAPNGSFAEYAITPDYTALKVPPTTSFEEAATIPLAALTAATGLYHVLHLPPPWEPATKPTPLIIYGAASAVGAFVIKYACLSNIHPIIAIAGRGLDFVETLIDQSKGDVILDYRGGDKALVQALKDAVAKIGVDAIEYCFDAISEKGSTVIASQVMDPQIGKIGTVLDIDDTDKVKKGVQVTRMTVGWSHQTEWPEGSEERKQGAKIAGKQFSFLHMRFISMGLAHGWFTPHPYEVVEGGLNGVEKALKDLKAGKASAVKYVLRVSEEK